MKLTQNLTLPLFFKTATMGAHQSVGIFIGLIMFSFSKRFSAFKTFCFIGSGSHLGVAIENGRDVSSKCISNKFFNFPMSLNILGKSFLYWWLSLLIALNFPGSIKASIACPPSNGSSKFSTTYRSCCEEIFPVSDVVSSRPTTWISLWPGPYNLLFVSHTTGEFFKRTVGNNSHVCACI